VPDEADRCREWMGPGKSRVKTNGQPKKPDQAKIPAAERRGTGGNVRSLEIGAIKARLWIGREVLVAGCTRHRFPTGAWKR